MIARNRKDVNQDKRLKNLEKNVRGIKNEVELKYLDKAFTTTATTTGQLTLLNAMAAGTTQITRVGSQINMTSLQYKFSVTSSTAIVTPTEFRYIIFIDRQANGAAPPISGDPTSGAGTIALLNNVLIDLIHCPRQYETFNRFKILKDKTFCLNPQVSTDLADPATTMVGVCKEIKGYIKLGQMVKFGNDTTAVIGDINTNSLYLLTFMDVATSPVIAGGSRLYFKDA
uniref:hypothetical protein n=1 Tax=Limnohabitans sp. TaxID=1907725 RepID=UPI0040476664